MALVELYRETGEARHLKLAGYFVDQRGCDLLGAGRHGGAAYYQDHAPVRAASTVEGHAVRQLYLTAGVTDLYLETGEQALLDAILRQWHDMVSHKLFITGGVGSQHAGEAFGEPYELPNDRCYCETCAQIASMMWNWRMLLATGEARYADLFERTLYNGFLSGVSLDGRRYFYVNPLLSRGVDPLLGRKHIERPAWHSCACCPPNVMRTLASVAHYLATSDHTGLQIHQYTPATIRATLPSGGDIGLAMETNYPWSDTVTLRVNATNGTQSWRLWLRIPKWCQNATLSVNGQPASVPEAGHYAVIERVWQLGDVVELVLPMSPLFIEAHPRVDPARSSVAIQRGPLIYCFEQVDQSRDVAVLDTQIDTRVSPTAEWKEDLLNGVVVIRTAGAVIDTAGWRNDLYRPLDNARAAASRPVALTAVPYFAWANRGPGAMRVWITRQGTT